jgi:phospholipid-translocating ATPase
MSSISQYSAFSLANLALLAIMAVVCGIADSKIEAAQYPEGAPWLYGDDEPSDNPKINGLITWAFALITFVLLILSFI